MSPQAPITHVVGRNVRHSLAGFSLVEVTLALGIVGFAFVTLLGLVPSGLNIFRQSVDATVGSQIIQRISNDVQQADFDTLPATAATGPVLSYFDEQGGSVAKDSLSRVYDVSVAISKPTALPDGSNTAPGPTSSSLAQVWIRIANNPGKKTNPFTQTNGYTSYSLMVAKNK